MAGADHRGHWLHTPLLSEVEFSLVNVATVNDTVTQGWRRAVTWGWSCAKRSCQPGV